MSETENKPNQTVCVTGASGFVGAHVVRVLLERGFRVNATVRDVNNTTKTKHLLNLPGAAERLTLCPADLLTPGSFDEALENCDGVFHTASPFFLQNASRENLVTPAVEGTLNILRSVEKSKNIKRVVLTSSTAAVYADYGTRGTDYIYTENDWSLVDLLEQNKSYYALGKTLAERSAWDFMRNLNQPHFDLIVINPTWIFGPLLQSTLNESCKKISDYMQGIPEIIPNVTKTLVDVRDVALAHVLSYEDPNAEGRYLLIADSPYEEEICQAIREVCPENKKLPTKVSKETGVKMMFGPEQPNRYKFSCEKAKKLGIEFIGTKEMIRDTIQSLKFHKLIE